MNYTELKNNDDIMNFMQEFNYFHDSCLKELKYVSGSYVKSDLSMYPYDCHKSVNAIFHSQNSGLSAIEIEFLNVQRLNLVPRSEKFDSIILGAYFKHIEGEFYWAEDEGFDYQNPHEFHGTWLRCKGIKWRALR